MNIHALREQAESWGDKVAVCWRYGQSYELSSWWTTEGRQKRPDGRQAKTRAETKPKKTIVDRNKVAGFRWIWTCLVFRGDPVCVISHDISWYHAPYHALLQDTVYRYIVSISRIFGTDMEISCPIEILSIPNTIFCQSGAPSLVHQETKKRLCGGRTSEAVTFNGKRTL